MIERLFPDPLAQQHHCGDPLGPYVEGFAEQMAGQGKQVRVVSMPSVDTFEAQDEAYRRSVLPPEVRARVERGEELGSANDAVFGTVGSKQRGGAFGLLTGGRFTREGVYAETLCLALLPFVNPLYATSPNGTPAT